MHGGLDLGLLNFFKKGKSADSALDLPPPPPSLEEHHELPEFPDLDDKKDFDFGKEMDMKMPEFDSPHIDDSQADIAPVSGDEMDFDSELDDNMDIASPKPAASAARYEPNSAPRPKPAHRESRSFYVKVDDFRLMLGTIGSMKSDLRKSEDGLSKLESMKAAKDKSFDRVKASLEDVQKKLIFVDKTLFKGE